MNFLPTTAQIAHFLTASNDEEAERTLRQSHSTRYRPGEALASVLKAGNDSRAKMSIDELIKEGYE